MEDRGDGGSEGKEREKPWKGVATPMRKDKGSGKEERMPIKVVESWGWGDGCSGKSAYCSHRGPGLGSNTHTVAYNHPKP